jgi:hypothetical protein
MSDPSLLPHTEFGIRKLEMLMPWHRMMERDRVGQLDGAGWSGWVERFLIPRFQPREPRLPSFHPSRPLRRAGDPFPLDYGASTSRLPIPHFHPSTGGS